MCSSVLSSDVCSSDLFGNATPRLIELFGIKVEADLDGHLLYVVNEDAPGFIGRVGTTLGEAGVNIGTFHLGRRSAGVEAVLPLSVDAQVSPALEIGRASCWASWCQYV